MIINYLGSKKIRMEWEQIQVAMEMAEIPIGRGFILIPVSVAERH